MLLLGLCRLFLGEKSKNNWSVSDIGSNRMEAEFIYRYRSIENILKWRELEDHYIYFSRVSDLNDPLEGAKYLYWKGDAIVWKNLLRHYLHCTLRALLLALCDNEFDKESCRSFAREIPGDVCSPGYQEVYNKCCKLFFENSAVHNLVDCLSLNGRVVFAYELLLYLRTLHSGLVLKCLYSALCDQGIFLFNDPKFLDNVVDSQEAHLLRFISAPYQDNDVAEAIFAATCHVMDSLTFGRTHNNLCNTRKEILFIIESFPSYYVDALNDLIYPNFHVACFSDDPTNASMWSVYGDRHRGVCLKFKTTIDSENNKSIRLLTEYGINDRGKLYKEMHHTLNEIKYDAGFEKIDFFQSIGTIPLQKINRFWYTSIDDKISTIASSREDSNAWRENYWNTFSRIYSTKLPDWQHEKECRLVLNSLMNDYVASDSRKLKYNINDLDGIIFGINASNESKASIYDLVKDNFSDKLDLKFYQAHYSRWQKKIVLLPLRA